MKTKIKKRFICKECGYQSTNWIGKCPECLCWNSFEEEFIQQPTKQVVSLKQENALFNINDIQLNQNSTIKTEVNEINNFFGDGIVGGSVTLISGEPGIGKSTFLLYLSQTFNNLQKIFYFSGEESYTQIKNRSNRLKINHQYLFISNETDIEIIIDVCKNQKPDFIFIDSIQTCYSKTVDTSAGTISQIKYSAFLLIQLAKECSIPIFIIGHVNKSGDIAGPKILEHMVDVVINFEGDTHHNYRILKNIKNRFGSIDEILLFEMKEYGLILIENPSGYFIDNNDDQDIIGRCKTVIIEGRRPLIIDVEALVVPTIYSNPRRFSEGVDNARISRIAAILEKHINENLTNYDIYFNIPGGIKTNDVSIDLAIAMAIYSSKKKLTITNDIIIIGELSLTGKIRSINRLESRIKESSKFGIKKAIIPECNFNLQNTSLKKVLNIASAIEKTFIN